jgi:NSS family neurotransmitter:Na+ symporter
MGVIWNDFALPIGGLLTAVFVGWVWRVDRAIEEVELHGSPFPGRALWSVLIRWVCPVAIAAIIVSAVVSAVASM